MGDVHAHKEYTKKKHLILRSRKHQQKTRSTSSVSCVSLEIRTDGKFRSFDFSNVVGITPEKKQKIKDCRERIELS